MYVIGYNRTFRCKRSSFNCIEVAVVGGVSEPHDRSRPFAVFLVYTGNSHDFTAYGFIFLLTGRHFLLRFLFMWNLK
jgi:hypothetical protein